MGVDRRSTGMVWSPEMGVPRMNLTANQLVAYNLQRIRRELGLTQDEAAARLEPHVGSLWSKAVWSAAETSATSDRKREFTADEMVAFALAFGVPIAWFFMPPDVGSIGIRKGSQPGDLLDLLFGVNAGHDRCWSRLRRWLADNPRRAAAGRLAGAWLGRRYRELLEARMCPLNDLAGLMGQMAKTLVDVSQQTVAEAVQQEVSGASRRAAKKR